MSKMMNYQHNTPARVQNDVHAIAAGDKGIKALQNQFVEMWYLLRIEFKNVRDSWVWSIIMISAFPFITISFLSFFLTNPSEVTLIRVITGNMVFPIVLMGMNTYAIELSLAKHNGHFLFYSSSFHILFTSGWQSDLWMNIFILIGFFIVFLLLVLWKMDWRVER